MRAPLIAIVIVASLSACGPLWGIDLADVQAVRNADDSVTTILTARCSASSTITHGYACPDDGRPLCADSLIVDEADAQDWCMQEAPGSSVRDPVTPQPSVPPAFDHPKACNNVRLGNGQTTTFAMTSSQPVPTTGYVAVVYVESPHMHCEILMIP
jgi:hypothetical protein